MWWNLVQVPFVTFFHSTWNMFLKLQGFIEKSSWLPRFCLSLFSFFFFDKTEKKQFHSDNASAPVLNCCPSPLLPVETSKEGPELWELWSGKAVPKFGMLYCYLVAMVVCGNIHTQLEPWLDKILVLSHSYRRVSLSGRSHQGTGVAFVPSGEWSGGDGKTQSGTRARQDWTAGTDRKTVDSSARLPEQVRRGCVRFSIKAYWFQMSADVLWHPVCDGSQSQCGFFFLFFFFSVSGSQQRKKKSRCCKKTTN